MAAAFGRGKAEVGIGRGVAALGGTGITPTKNGLDSAFDPVFLLFYQPRRMSRPCPPHR
jgi:hypothetical protein